MGTRRQPSQRFLRRLKGSSEPSAKQPSPIRQFRDSDYWLWAEVTLAVAGLAGFIFLVPTGYALWVDLEDRQTQRIAQAWQLITQVAPGNSGKIQALEYLNSSDCTLSKEATIWQRVKACGISAMFVSPKQKEKLHGIDLSYKTHSSSVYLTGVNLSGVFLINANLSRASLSGANLSGAWISTVNLSGANLMKADLSGATLFNVNLSGAWLLGTDLAGAYLFQTDLREVKALSQKMLDDACGDEKTQLPKGLTIKKCPEIVSGAVPPVKP